MNRFTFLLRITIEIIVRKIYASIGQKYSTTTCRSRPQSINYTHYGQQLDNNIKKKKKKNRHIWFHPSQHFIEERHNCHKQSKVALYLNRYHLNAFESLPSQFFGYLTMLIKNNPNFGVVHEIFSHKCQKVSNMTRQFFANLVQGDILKVGK